jgi:hypothetical protein
MGFPDWQIDLPLDLEVGKSYIVKAKHKQFWASLLITVTGYDPAMGWKIDLETILDGSPGIVEGFDGYDSDRPTDTGV